MPGNEDLHSRLDGLFDETLPENQPDREPSVQPVESTIFDILEGKVGPEPPPSPEDIGVPLIEPDIVAAASSEFEGQIAGEITPSELISHPSPEGEQPLSPSVTPMPDFVTWEDELAIRQRQVLNIILRILAGIGAIIIGFLFWNLVQDPLYWLPTYIPYLAAYGVLLILALAQRMSISSRASMLILLSYVMGIAALLSEGPLSAGGLYLLAAPILATTLIRQQTGAITMGISIVLYAVFLLADHFGWLQPSAPYRADVLPSILSLIATFVMISVIIFLTQFITKQALIGALREAEQKHSDLVTARRLLEKRADELGRANAELQKRTLQLQTVAQISGAATYSVTEPETLTQQIVQLIKERFNLSYVGLFFTDETNQWATLQACAGSKEHITSMPLGSKIEVDLTSPVGWCILNTQPRIALDTRLGLPTMPDTCSELALPLRSRGRVIGALTLQSDTYAAFSQGDIPVLQTMAEQIAVAIDNAHLYAEAQASLQEVEEIQRRYVRQQWAKFLTSSTVPFYEQTQPDTPPLDEEQLTELEQALQQQEVIISAADPAHDGQRPSTLVIPIRLRGEPIGAVGLQETAPRRQWTDAEIALIETIADQMALAIENARLLEETQRRAERERLTAEIVARVRASAHVDTILRTAVREMGRALRASEGIIHVAIGEDVETSAASPPHTDETDGNNRHKEEELPPEPAGVDENDHPDA